jgi:hypothetical protein
VHQHRNVGVGLYRRQHQMAQDDFPMYLRAPARSKASLARPTHMSDWPWLLPMRPIGWTSIFAWSRCHF